MRLELIHLALSFKTLLLTKITIKNEKQKQKLKRQREQKKKAATTFLSLECKEANDNWFEGPKKIRKAKKSN